MYSVRQFFQTETYALVILRMSPGCNKTPGSSQTERLMEPVLSATLHDLTSCPSLVTFGLPVKQNKKGHQSKLFTEVFLGEHYRFQEQ